MDIASIIGIIGGFVIVFWSIQMNGSLRAFIDIPSVLITIGGTITSTLLSYPLSKIIASFRKLGIIFKKTPDDSGKIISRIIELANVARKEGLLALEDELKYIENSFLKKGIMLVIDGTDPDLVRNILETELTYTEERQKEEQGVLKTMATFAPAFGMIGTLIGLINMLKNLNDPSKVGPGMAVALITTFYGSILAYVLFIPLEKKLGVRNRREIFKKEVMLEGILSIQAGENPRIIEEKLRAFFGKGVINKQISKDKMGSAVEGEINAQKTRA